MAEVTLTVNLAGLEPRNPVSIFHLGQGFFLAGNRCLLNIDVAPGITQCLVSPGVVNLCLAIELFLKSVIVARGALAPKSHKLKELFALVSPEFVAELRASFNASVPTPAFDELLEQVSNYFVEIRYGHEFNVFAFHEHPVYVLGKLLYIQSARVHGQKTGIEVVRV
jgi:HEPN domain